MIFRDDGPDSPNRPRFGRGRRATTTALAAGLVLATVSCGDGTIWGEATSDGFDARFGIEGVTEQGTQVRGLIGFYACTEVGDYPVTIHGTARVAFTRPGGTALTGREVDFQARPGSGVCEDAEQQIVGNPEIVVIDITSQIATPGTGESDRLGLQYAAEFADAIADGDDQLPVYQYPPVA